MSRYRLLIGGALLLVALGVTASLLIPPPAEDTGPLGTAALKRLLTIRGIDLSSADAPGSPDQTFFLPYDFRSGAQARGLVEWVRGGGHLVVADPESATLVAAGIQPAGGVVAGFLPAQRLEVDCVAPAVAGVGRVVAGAVDDVLLPSEPAGVACFHRGEGSFLVQLRLGRGEVVALGGLTPLTNEYLEDEDDVVLAWNLLGAPGRPVVIGTPLPAGAGQQEGLWSLLPLMARVMIVQVALATLLFALARGRRLGSPMEERPPSPIPATELVTATGELYRRAGAAPHGLRLLQDRFRSRVGRRLGLPPDAGDEEVARAASSAARVDPEEVQRALVPRPADEGVLVRAGGELERLERRIEGDVEWKG